MKLLSMKNDIQFSFGVWARWTVTRPIYRRLFTWLSVRSSNERDSFSFSSRVASQLDAFRGTIYLMNGKPYRLIHEVSGALAGIMVNSHSLLLALLASGLLGGFVLCGDFASLSE